MFSLRADSDRDFLIYATHDDQRLAAADNYNVRAYDRRTRLFERTVFFTERSLYRPGQTIRYDGLSVHVDQEEDNYQVLSNRSLTVVFVDGNGNETERRTERTNDYGTFSGSFTAPRDRVIGEMRIVVESGPAGQTDFHVEEYKRPKFQVRLDAPATAARLLRVDARHGQSLFH